MTNHQETGDAFADWLARQALWPAMAVAVILIAAPATILAIGLPLQGAPAAVLALLATAGGLATLALSALIRFDAALFHLMASHGDQGGSAVDDVLERMRLKSRPERARKLEERMFGARRLVFRQRLAFGVFALAVAIMPIAALPW